MLFNVTVILFQATNIVKRSIVKVHPQIAGMNRDASLALILQP